MVELCQMMVIYGQLFNSFCGECWQREKTTTLPKPPLCTKPRAVGARIYSISKVAAESQPSDTKAALTNTLEVEITTCRSDPS